MTNTNELQTMKVLYAIQGTGNGHLSRARDVIPILQSKNIELDLLVSGVQADVNLPYEIKYKFHGLSFIFGKKGGVDLWKTYSNANLSGLRKDIKNLPIEQYDLIINDFEPVSAWAAKLKNIPCVSFSHQAAILSKNAPKPKKPNFAGRQILKRYAPTQKQFGIHFKKYNNNIFTPVIRKEIREAETKKLDHYTVYLPAYDDRRILKLLSQIPEANWQVFSKHNRKVIKEANVHIQPINNESFIESLLTCKGLFCGGGFEAPAEALFLKKKLMVIPMKGQYEQQCNAAALHKMGVPVISSLKKKNTQKIKQWVLNSTPINVNFPNQTEVIIDQILSYAKNN